MNAKGMTLYEAKHAFTFVVSEDSDGAGYLSRDIFLADGASPASTFSSARFSPSSTARPLN